MEKIIKTYRTCKGIVFIGDPHVSSVKPGRRTDKNYPETILNKIEFIANYCNENELVAVFLGDIYESAVEKDEALKTRLLRLLKSFNLTPVSNVGNHDISNQTLTDHDSLKYLEEAGAIKVAAISGALETFEIAGKNVSLGATPYGQNIPTDARQYFPKSDTIIWITHHDLAFEGAYPGSQELHQIKGCKLAVNGHMHLKKDLIRVGETTWYNPGNITRQAVDAIDHIPMISVLTEKGGLKTVVIPHEKSVFDLTGRLIESISPGEKQKSQDIENNPESAFVSLLEANSSMEMEKSDDGSIIMEDIISKFERDQTDDVVQNIVLSIHKKSLAQT